MKIKYIYPKCAKCRNIIRPTQAIRFVWKKRNADIDLCPKCFAKIYSDHLKDVHIDKQTMIKSGYYEQGAREVDFKHYLEKWAKKEKNKR